MLRRLLQLITLHFALRARRVPMGKANTPSKRPNRRLTTRIVKRGDFLFVEPTPWR